MAALRQNTQDMTLAEFLGWNPEGNERWQLREGVPELMAPASDAHGSIQNELGFLLTAYLRTSGRPCRVVTAPGVIPRLRSADSFLIPDLGITCTPVSGTVEMPNPVALIEILSPSNERQTRANVWAYGSIPTVTEIVLLRSDRIAGEIWRRNADGSWPAAPLPIAADGDLTLESIGYAAPLRAAYRTSGLAA
jgi:Uma2 family endonuclease